MAKLDEQIIEMLLLELNRISNDFLDELYNLINEIDYNNFDRKEYLKTEKQIDQIFLKYEVLYAKWVDKAIETGFKEGAAGAILDLEDAVVREEAFKMFRMTRNKKQIIDLIKKTTYNDLLKMTNNTKQQTKDLLTRVVTEVMKGKEYGRAEEDFSREIIRQLKQQIKKEMDFAIIDRAGRHWTIKAYSEMVARTKIMQSYLDGVETEALAREANYGLISAHSSKCNICRPWEGLIVRLRRDAPGNFPLLSGVRSIPGKKSIFHPNCKHHISPLRTLDVLPPQAKERNNIRKETDYFDIR